jgi:hypothetical protein
MARHKLNIRYVLIPPLGTTREEVLPGNMTLGILPRLSAVLPPSTIIPPEVGDPEIFETPNCRTVAW